MSKNSPYMTRRQVADYIGVSEVTIRRWVDEDEKFPRPFKKNQTVRFRREEIEEYCERHRDE